MVDRWLAAYSPDDVVAALAPQLTAERRARIEEVLAQRLAGLTVVLEDLHDPHNGAAALRSVEGFGLCELHVVEQAEPFRSSADEPARQSRAGWMRPRSARSPRLSQRVTQGCQKWVAVQRHPDFAACAAALHARGFSLYAAVPGAALTVDQIDVSRPAALVFGNEHAGLTSAAQAACDATFAIPMAGFTQSFNLSVSVALSVYDTTRRRRAQLGGAPGDVPDEERARLRARWYALSMDERAAEGLVARHVSERTRGGVGEPPRGC